MELKQHLIALENHYRLINTLRIARDNRALGVLVAKGADIERYVLLLQGLYGLGVYNLRTAICHLYGIHIVKALNLASIGEDFGVGIEYAIDILPHAHRLGIEDIGDDSCRVVGALTAEGCGCAIGSWMY